MSNWYRANIPRKYCISKFGTNPTYSLGTDSTIHTIGLELKTILFDIFNEAFQYKFTFLPKDKDKVSIVSLTIIKNAGHTDTCLWISR